jgi:hypothetical protein
MVNTIKKNYNSRNIKFSKKNKNKINNNIKFKTNYNNLHGGALPAPAVISPVQQNVKIIIDSNGDFEDINKCINALNWTQYIDTVYAYGTPRKNNILSQNRYQYNKNNDNKTFTENKTNFSNKTVSISNEILKYGSNNLPFLIYIDDNNEIKNSGQNPNNTDPMSIVYGEYGLDPKTKMININTSFIDNANTPNDLKNPSKNINYIFIKLPHENKTNNLISYWSTRLKYYLDTYQIHISNRKKLLIVYDFDCTLTSEHLWKSLNKFPIAKKEFNDAFTNNNNTLIEAELNKYFGNQTIRDKQSNIFNYMKTLNNIPNPVVGPSPVPAPVVTIPPVTAPVLAPIVSTLAPVQSSVVKIIPQNTKYNVKFIISNNTITFDGIIKFLEDIKWKEYVNKIYARKEIKSDYIHIFEKNISDNNFVESKSQYKSNIPPNITIGSIINDENNKYDAYKHPLLIYIDKNNIYNNIPNTIVYGFKRTELYNGKDVKHIKLNDNEDIPIYGTIGFIGINYVNHKDYMEKLIKFFKVYKTNTNLPKEILFIYNLDNDDINTNSVLKTDTEIQNFIKDVKDIFELPQPQTIKIRQPPLMINPIIMNPNLTKEERKLYFEQIKKTPPQPPKVKIIIITFNFIDIILKCINLFDWAQYIDVIYACETNPSAIQKLHQYVKHNNSFLLNPLKFDMNETIINEIAQYYKKDPKKLPLLININKFKEGSNVYEIGIICSKYKFQTIQGSRYYSIDLSKVKRIYYDQPDEIPIDEYYNHIQIEMSHFDDNSKNKIYIDKLNRFLDNYKNTFPNHNILIVYDFNNVLTKKNMFKDFKHTSDATALTNFFTEIDSNDNQRIEQSLYEYFDPYDIRDEQKTIFKYMKNLFDPYSIKLNVELAPDRLPLGYKVSEIAAPSATLPTVPVTVPAPVPATLPTVPATLPTVPTPTPVTVLSSSTKPVLINTSYCY